MSYSVEEILEHFGTYNRGASVKVRMPAPLITPAAYPGNDIRATCDFEVADLEVETDDDGQTVYLRVR